MDGVEAGHAPQGRREAPRPREHAPQRIADLDADETCGKSRDRDLLELDDERIARTLLADARAKAPPGWALPRCEDVALARVCRWRETVCKGLPGMFTAMTRMRQDMTEDLQSLRIAGDFMRSPVMNGAITSGVETASEVAGCLEACS